LDIKYIFPEAQPTAVCLKCHEAITLFKYTINCHFAMKYVNYSAGSQCNNRKLLWEAGNQFTDLISFIDRQTVIQKSLTVGN